MACSSSILEADGNNFSEKNLYILGECKKTTHNVESDDGTPEERGGAETIGYYNWKSPYEGSSDGSEDGSRPKHFWTAKKTITTEKGQQAPDHLMSPPESKLKPGSKSMMVKSDALFTTEAADSKKTTGHSNILDRERMTLESYEYFKEKVQTLRKETSLLSRELKRQANYCKKLQKENKLLLDELRQRCTPDVISVLEAKNPHQNPQSDDG